MASIGISSPVDDNGVKAILATDSTQTNRPVLLYADPDTHALYVTPPVENIQNATTPVYATNLIVKTSGGKLKGLTGYNSKGSPQFIQIFDANALPQDNAIPKVFFTVSAVSNFNIDWGLIGRYFTVGIVVCNSSTGPTKTIGSADCWFDAQFV